jgi:hypothetical protein
MIIVLGVLGGCGGGTQGTGGIAIEGRILKTDGTGLSDTTVTVAQTGDSTTTDQNGSFSLRTSVVGDASLLLESTTFSTEVAIGTVSTNTATVRLTISVNEDDNSSSIDEIEFEERDDDDDGNSGSNNGSSDDDDDDSSSSENGEDDDEDDESENESESEDDDESENDDSENEIEDDESESSHSGSSGSGNGESENNESGSGSSNSTCQDEDLTGPITQVSATSITVGGVTFIITSETRIEDASGDPISVEALSSGVLVRVQGQCEGEDLIAERIRITE